MLHLNSNQKAELANLRQYSKYTLESINEQLRAISNQLELLNTKNYLESSSTREQLLNEKRQWQLKRKQLKQQVSLYLSATLNPLQRDTLKSSIHKQPLHLA